MTSHLTQQKNEPRTLLRKGNFQQMIDIEKKQKINRMQSPTPQKMPFTPPQPIQASQLRPTMSISPFSKAPERSTTLPSLSLSIPQSDATSIPRSVVPPDQGKAYNGVFALPSEEGKNDAGYNSDKSSLCQSPGWDDAETRKQKKLKQLAREKKKKEKEKAEKEVRQRENQPKRLVKQQPINKFSRMVMLSDRSSSAPAIPTRSNLRAEKHTEQTSNVSGGKENNDGRKQAVTQLTKSAGGSPESSRPSSFQRINSLQVNTGFIGGLRLQKAEESIHQSTQNQTSAANFGNRPATDATEIACDGGSGHKQSKSVDFARQVEGRISSDNTELSHEANLTHEKIKPATTHPPSIMDRPIKRGHKSKVSIDAYLNPDSAFHNETKALYDSDTTRVNSPEQDAFTSSEVPSEISKSKNNEVLKNTSRLPRKTGTSPERPPISYREPPALTESRGRQHKAGYVKGHRQQSQNRSIAALEEEGKASIVTGSIKSHSRGRSWSIKSFGRRRRNSSTSRPTTSDSSKTSMSQGEDNYHDFIASNYTTCTPDQHVPEPVAILKEPLVPSGHNRRLSKFSPIILKNVAKSAFTRHSHSPTSPSFNEFQANQDKTSKDANATLKTRNSNLSMYSSSSKADRILGESVTSTTGRRYIKKNQSHGSKSGFDFENSSTLVSKPVEPDVNELSTTASASKVVESTPSTSNSDLMEDPEKLVSSTDNSQPFNSQPLSRKERFLTKGENTTGLNSHPLEKGNAEPPKGALLFNNNERVYKLRNQTSPQKDHDDESIKELVTKKSVPNFSHHKQPSTDTTKSATTPATDQPSSNKLQRHPSLSRSVSTPELQDLSFLPQLKHQPLTKPSKGKNIPQPTKPTRSEGSSPISPLSGPSSIHLHKRRPSQPSISKTRFPAPGQATPMANIDPIAKMLVVCCSCRYFHDMPSKLYECMAKPDDVVEDKALGVSGVISTSVKCPWCGHGMSVRCCEGYAAVVYLRERLH